MCQRGQLEKIMDAAANGMDLKGRDDENISTLHWVSAFYYTYTKSIAKHASSFSLPIFLSFI